MRIIDSMAGWPTSSNRLKYLWDIIYWQGKEPLWELNHITLESSFWPSIKILLLFVKSHVFLVFFIVGKSIKVEIYCFIVHAQNRILYFLSPLPIPRASNRNILVLSCFDMEGDDVLDRRVRLLLHWLAHIGDNYILQINEIESINWAKYSLFKNNIRTTVCLGLLHM